MCDPINAPDPARKSTLTAPNTANRTEISGQTLYSTIRMC